MLGIMARTTARDRQYHGLVRPADSVQVVLYRIGALFLWVVWPLWILQLVLTRTGPDSIFDHWYVTTTVLLFVSAELFLVDAWLSGGLRILTVALGYCGVTLVIALLLLFADPFTGSVDGTTCLWFSGMTGVPAVAFALTVRPPVATAFFIPTIGAAALADSLYGGERDIVYLVGVVGFALIYSYYFVAVASTMIRLVRTVDANSHGAHHQRQRAEDLRGQVVAEDVTIRRLRRRVLYGLEEISHGRVPEDPRSDPAAAPAAEPQGSDAGTHATGWLNGVAWAPENPSMQEATGFDRVFSWPYLLICAVVLVFRMASSVTVTAAAVVTCSVLVVALALLGTRNWSVIPMRRALIIVVALCGATVAGMWQQPGAGDVVTAHWELGAISLVAALLATRGRAAVAVGGVVAAVVVTAVVDVTGISPEPRALSVGLALNSIVVLAAVLLRRAVDHFVRQIPGAQEDYRAALAEADAVASTVAGRHDDQRSLLATVAPFFDAATRVDGISPALARRAGLMRLQIMDEVTAPRLAVPALQEAVWDARGRGVTVRLVDDGEGEDAALTESQAADLLARYLPVIDNATEGSVTVHRTV